MIFWRIYNNTLYDIGTTDELGFSSKDPSFIPDEYLQQKQFVIFRTCFGIGDWGILTAMPRLLKQKYPDCKVYLPSIVLLERVFGKRDLFDDTYKSVLSLFDNNPYVDGFVDNVHGDIFHDHYRIYDVDNINTPLINQILKFWQFTESEYTDSQPELYWSDQEIFTGNEIIRTYIPNNKFGCLLLSNRFGTNAGNRNVDMLKNDTEKITKLLKDNIDYPFMYWSYKPLMETPFNFINSVLDLRNIPLRIQLYLKSKANLNIANQCGTNHLIVRYSTTYEVQRQFPLKGNFIKGINYL